MAVRTFQNGPHSFAYSDEPQTLPRKVVHELKGVLAKWQSAVPREPTYAQTRYGVPCFLARLRCVISESGVDIYEIQDNPGWAGYAGLANDDFRRRRDMFVNEKWPAFRLLQDSSVPRDDGLWLKEIALSDALASDTPLLLRYWEKMREVSVDDTWSLILRSIGPFWTHNDKSYGVPLGLWRYVRADESADASHLPWDTAFVLKPLRHWGSTDLVSWVPEERKGRSTRTQIANTLRQHRVMFLQKFIRPMSMEISGSKYNAILRPFFAYDPAAKEWEALGGVWTARPAPNFRIHGASDTISGPLVFEE